MFLACWHLYVNIAQEYDPLSRLQSKFWLFFWVIVPSPEVSFCFVILILKSFSAGQWENRDVFMLSRTQKSLRANIQIQRFLGDAGDVWEVLGFPAKT